MIQTEDAAREYCAQIADASALERLERLTRMLTEENDRQNLVANSSLAAVWQRHIADSAQLLRHVPRGTPEGPWMDLGSGAGFPGLVISALRPDLEVCLVESRRKRIEWLERAASELALEKCRVLGARLENVETFPVGTISARAFAPLGRLLDLSNRFSTRSTLWLLPKGRSAAQELAELPREQREMFHVEHSATDSEAGIIVGTGRPWAA